MASAVNTGKRKLPGVSGAIAAGLVLLTVFVLAAQVWAWTHGFPGPGTAMALGHVVCACAAIAAQRVVDRDTGRRAGVGAALVVVATAAVLAIFWWY